MPQGRRGVLTLTFQRFGQFLAWLLFSLFFSISLEWIGMSYWWQDEGAQHSLDMYQTEVGYLANDVQPTLIANDPARFAANVSGTVYEWVWVKTGLVGVVEWIGKPPDAGASAVHEWLHDRYQYAVATIATTQVFFVRVAILILALPVFLMAGVVGVTDGLTERDLRTWSGGRESGYVFHISLIMIMPALILAWTLYLSMPISIHPALVVLPFAILFALAIRLAAASFKKYL